jgi:hypothetical protein
MTNPTAMFSIVAHEAYGHKITDGENDDDINQDDAHNASQRSRRRIRVSGTVLITLDIIFIS